MTGGLLTEEAAAAAGRSPAYWRKQALEPVRFEEAMKALLAAHDAKAASLGEGPWAPFAESCHTVGIDMGEGMMAKFGESIAGGQQVRVGRRRRTVWRAESKGAGRELGGSREGAGRKVGGRGRLGKRRSMST